MTTPLRVHFDQNCMNARGTDAHLRAIQELHDRGAIVLVANARNRWELGHPARDGEWHRTARARLERFEQSPEIFRFNASPMGSADDHSVGAVCSSVTDPEPLSVAAVRRIIFPGQAMPHDDLGEPGLSVLDRGQNSLHDVMHVANAHDGRADVLLTMDGAILSAREQLYTELAFGPRIESPAEFLLRFQPLPPSP